MITQECIRILIFVKVVDTALDYLGGVAYDCLLDPDCRDSETRDRITDAVDALTKLRIALRRLYIFLGCPGSLPA